MKKNLFSSLLAILILFWAVGVTSYSQEKTKKAPTKTEKVVKKTSTKAKIKKEKVSKASVASKKAKVKKERLGKLNMASKHRMLHKHYMKSAKKHNLMKVKKKTSSTKKEKSK